MWCTSFNFPCGWGGETILTGILWSFYQAPIFSAGAPVTTRKRSDTTFSFICNLSRPKMVLIPKMRGWITKQVSASGPCRVSFSSKHVASFAWGPSFLSLEKSWLNPSLHYKKKGSDTVSPHLSLCTCSSLGYIWLMRWGTGNKVKVFC